MVKKTLASSSNQQTTPLASAAQLEGDESPMEQSVIQQPQRGGRGRRASIRGRERGRERRSSRGGGKGGSEVPASRLGAQRPVILEM